MDELKQHQHILVKKGAEASLYLSDWQGRRVIVKIRMPKKYRVEALDGQIRSYRTIHEAQLLHRAKAAGVATPLIYMVNVSEAIIIMEYIEGVQVKQYLNSVQDAEREKICLKIGELIGKLHRENLIHGDLSTFNILNHDEYPVIIDVSQSVVRDHPIANELLIRDIKNIYNEFKKMGSSISIEEIKEKLEVDIDLDFN